MIIDAYAHVGYPRYGRPDELLATWEQWGISRGCIALPPGMPDFSALDRARASWGDRVRLFGIPYGPDAPSRTELAVAQIEFGIAGMRFMPDEVLANPDVLALLGEAGLCLMAINVYASTEVTRAAIDWLERYPNGSIAAPHFLRVGPIDGDACTPPVADAGAFRELLRHPRMHAIFSRHGGASSQPHPHGDLRPWVEDILPLLGWGRVLWGSEIPVIYHRDEQVDEALSWVTALGLRPSDDELAAYRGGNAERLFFSRHAPQPKSVAFPPWVTEGLERFIAASDPVPVVRSRALNLPLELHGRLLSRYLHDQRSEPGLRFQAWLVRELRRLEA